MNAVERVLEYTHLGNNNRVDRVLGFFSSHPNWDSPNPSPADKCVPPPPFGPGGTQSLVGDWVHGVPYSDEGTDHAGVLTQEKTSYVGFFPREINQREIFINKTSTVIKS
jgi:hypothetical protein